MDRMIYLLNMSMSGIKNIEKEIRIDFYGKTVNKNFEPEKNKIKVIYGENGSGKTAIITAIDIVKEFIINENYLRSLQNQTLLAELINKKTKEFMFRCEFVTLIDSLVIYEYEVGFSFDENGEVYVAYESLKYKRNNSKNIKSTAYICENGEFVELNLNEIDKAQIIDKTKNLLAKQSALYLLFKMTAHVESKNEDRLIFAYATIFFIMVFTYFDKEDRHITYYQRMRLDELKRNKLPLESILDEISRSVPTNEKEVPIAEYDHYKKQIIGLERFIKLFKPSLKRINIEKTEDKEIYICRMVMDYGDYSIDREFESTGIKHLIDIYDALKMASFGAIVFIDEMDTNINDVMLSKIIEYFKLYCIGQLCVTSHNTEPMIVLKDNNKSIDFLTSDNRIVSWVKNGHYSPESCYRNGMIEGMPFNIDSSDFISVFGEDM